MFALLVAPVSAQAACIVTVLNRTHHPIAVSTSDGHRYRVVGWHHTAAHPVTLKSGTTVMQSADGPGALHFTTIPGTALTIENQTATIQPGCHLPNAKVDANGNAQLAWAYSLEGVTVDAYDPDADR